MSRKNHSIERSSATSVPVGTADSILEAALRLKAVGDLVLRQAQQTKDAYLQTRLQLRRDNAGLRELRGSLTKARDDKDKLERSLALLDEAGAVPGHHGAEVSNLRARAEAELTAALHDVTDLTAREAALVGELDQLGASMRTMAADPAVQELLHREREAAGAQASHRKSALAAARAGASAIERFRGLAGIETTYGPTVELRREIEVVVRDVFTEARQALKAPMEESLVAALCAAAEVHEALPEGAGLRKSAFGVFADLACAGGFRISRRELPLSAAKVVGGRAIVVAAAPGGAVIGAAVHPRNFRSSAKSDRTASGEMADQLRPLAEALNSKKVRTATVSTEFGDEGFVERLRSLAAAMADGDKKATPELERLAQQAFDHARSTAEGDDRTIQQGLCDIAELHGLLPPSSRLRKAAFCVFADLACARGYDISRRGMPLSAAWRTGDGLTVVAAAPGGAIIGDPADPALYRTSGRTARAAREVEAQDEPPVPTDSADEVATVEADVEEESLAADTAEGPEVDLSAELAGTVDAAPEEGQPVSPMSEADEEALRAHFGVTEVPRQRSSKPKGRGAAAEGKSLSLLRKVVREKNAARAEGLEEALRGVTHGIADVDALAVALEGWEKREMGELVETAVSCVKGRAKLREAQVLSAADELKPGWRSEPCLATDPSEQGGERDEAAAPAPALQTPAAA